MSRIAIAICFLLAVGVYGETAGKLSLKQVLALVAAAPDQVAANEIRQLGVSFVPSRDDIVRVQQAGGGPRAVEALRRFIVMPVLLVRSNQERSEVFLDGAAKGTAGPGQSLAIRDADPGSHTVTVKKARYSTAEMPVTLTAGKTSELSANLTFAEASLSVTTNVPNARVQIEGVDLAGRSGSAIELAPGTYVVHVSAPKFTEGTKSVTLKAGDIAQVQIPLTLDPSFTRSLVAQALTEQAAGRYPAAYKLAADALSIEPANAQALGVEAMSDFYMGQYQAFAQIGLRAVQAGAELDVPVVHRHALRASHLAVLKLHNGIIGYEPNGQPGASCNTPAFEVLIADVESVGLKQDGRGQRFLAVKLAGPGLPKSENLLFADYRSRVEAQGNGLPFLVGPPNGADEITATASLLQSLQRSSHP